MISYDQEAIVARRDAAGEGDYMKTVKGYANYGVIGNEKRTVFTVDRPAEATLSEEIELYIPEEFKLAENAAGNTLIDTPDGTTYMLSEILGSDGDNPVLRWIGKNNERRTAKLKWNEL